MTGPTLPQNQAVRYGRRDYIHSNLFVQSLASAAEVGLQFFTKTQVPVYYGDAGLNKILLHGALRENVGVDELVIPFMPYEDGAGGPVFKSIGSATPLAAAEIVLSERYPVTVYKL